MGTAEAVIEAGCAAHRVVGTRSGAGPCRVVLNRRATGNPGMAEEGGDAAEAGGHGGFDVGAN